MNAVSLYTIGFNLARIVGPSLGGILILWIGVGGCYSVFAASLILAAIGLLLIRLKDERAANPDEDFMREFKEGFQYVWASPVILSSIVAAYTFSIFIVTYQRFLPVFAKEILDVGPEGLGLLMAAPGVGAIASLTFLASVGERWNRAKLLWITTTVTPIFLILFYVSPVFWLSVVLLGCGGSGTGQLSHHQPSHHSSRDSTGTFGAGDERLQHGPGNALPGFRCDGRLRHDLWRLPRSRAHRRRLADRYDDALLPPVGKKSVTRDKTNTHSCEIQNGVR